MQCGTWQQVVGLAAEAAPWVLYCKLGCSVSWYWPPGMLAGCLKLIERLIGGRSM
jgi:hypothetical protein